MTPFQHLQRQTEGQIAAMGHGSAALDEDAAKLEAMGADAGPTLAEVGLTYDLSHHHRIRVTETLQALGINLTEFEAEITVTCIPESGNGWDEPREARTYEYAGVTQMAGPFIPVDRLDAWARQWVDESYSAIDQDISSNERL